MLLDEPLQRDITQLVLLREFRDEESLREFIVLLKKSDIEFILHDSASGFDASFAFNKTTRFWQIWVDQTQEEHARLISDQFDHEIIDQLTEDYYLFSFTNKELLDLLNHPEEWSSIDVLLAKKLLDREGIPIDSDEIASKIQLSKTASDKSESVPQYVIVAGYIFSVIGGAFGLAIALTLLFSKKTTSNGERIQRFDNATRNQAYLMLAVFVIVLIVTGGYFITLLVPQV